MPIYGRYEVVERVHDSPSLTVSRARMVDGRYPQFLVTVFHPPASTPEEVRQQSQAFSDRVQLQQQLGGRPDSHWAPIRHLGILPTGAFYVADEYPATLQSLLAQHTRMNQHALYATVNGIVSALSQLQSAFRRPHGNLNTSNVSLDQKRSTDARVLVSDPASAADAKAAGTAADLHALGAIIYALVMAQPFDPTWAWPVPDGPRWEALGAAGRHWQKLCSDLLSPKPAPGVATISDVRSVLDEIGSVQRLPLWRRLPRQMRGALAATAACVILALAGVCLLDYMAQRHLANAKQNWLGPLAAAVNDEPRNRRYQADPGLRAMLSDLQAANVSTIDPQPSMRSLRPWLYPRARAQLQAVTQVRDDLTTGHWQRLADLLARADQFEERGWANASLTVRAVVADVKAGPNLPASIDRVLAVREQLARDLPDLETDWGDLTHRTHDLGESGDRFLAAAGAMYQSSAAAAVSFTPAGLSGRDAVREQANHAQQLVDVVHDSFAEKYNRGRLDNEVVAKMDLAHLTPQDVAVWKTRLPDYLIRRDAIATAVADLTLRLQKKAHQVAPADASPASRLALSQSLTKLDVQLKRFDKTPFIALDLADGSFAARRQLLESDIDSLGVTSPPAIAVAPSTEPAATGHSISGTTASTLPATPTTRTFAQATQPATTQAPPIASGTGALIPATSPTTRTFASAEQPIATRPVTPPTPPAPPVAVDSTPAGWISTLPVMSGSSDVITGYWEDWRHVLQNSTAEMSAKPRFFEAMKTQSTGLYEALLELSKTFPPMPADLPPSFAAAAGERREREIGKALAQIDPRDARAALPATRQAADAFAAWEQKLVALSADFPLRGQIVQIGQRPDLKWAKSDASFWRDPAIVGLVRADVERIHSIADLQKLSRGDLADAAASSTSIDVTIAAWQLLGGGAVVPLWPTRPGELEAERDLRQKIAAMVKTLQSAEERESIGAVLDAQGQVRWARFVEAANSEPMLAIAHDLRSSFGDPVKLAANLTPVARFNLALYQARQQNAMDDAAARQLADTLARSAGDLTDHALVSAMTDRLATLQTPERFADRKPADRFTLNIAGAEGGIVFQRVQSVQAHPYYLGTVDVSVGQFINVVSAANAWERATAFGWGVEPGKRDTRRGPRVWEWTQKPALTMAVPLLWLTPDDDNDYLPASRITRFNRTALSDKVGGNPLPDHPMQHIPAEAALFYAGLCQSRLPTTAEWREAYAIFERTVPMERWNLRDQTWEAQRKYVSTITSTTQRWPDEAIFRPVGDTAPRGPEATARPETDGSLFFRTVNSPGGGTFHHLVGNVAEFVCDEPEAFDAWTDKQSVEGIRKFIQAYPAALQVIGGSALSPPEQPFDKPLPLMRADRGYSDVGFRLAFTAPSRSLAERLRWVLAGQTYLWEKPQSAAATAPTEAIAR